MTAVRLNVLAVVIAALSLASGPAAAQDRPHIWSGLYLGAHIGGAGFSGDFKQTATSGAVVSSGTSSDSGWGGGVFGGYNYQTGPWIIGVELDGTWGCNDNPSCLYTARARLGYALGNALLYGTGGVSWHEQELTWNNSLTGQRTTQSDTAVGFVVGGGIDYRFAASWSLRGEGLYARHGDTEFTSPSGSSKVTTNDSFGIGRVGVSYHFK